MDDDSMDDQDYDLEYSDDSESEPDIDLENLYYQAKGLKADGDFDGALQSLERILSLEAAKGEWGFKALKQLVKMTFATGDSDTALNYYKQLLTYIKSAVTKNYSEKSINSMLEHISTSKQTDLLQTFYETTLDALKDAKNERLWFKTNIKLGKLCFERKDFAALKNILKLLRASCKNDKGEEDQSKGTYLLEIYALEIQMYTEQKNNKALKALYNRSLSIKSAIPHPLVMGIIRECGGKMHLREKYFEEANVDFFEAFKSYDESGSSRRSACLRYMVLSNMLMKSDINPFESPETKPLRFDPDIVAMNHLVEAYQKADLEDFERTVSEHRDAIMGDPFMREHIEELLSNIRSQVLLRLCVPYKRVRLTYLAEALHMTEEELKRLLKELILDGAIHGKIDEVDGLLAIDAEPASTRCEALEVILTEMGNFLTQIDNKIV